MLPRSIAVRLLWAKFVSDDDSYVDNGAVHTVKKGKSKIERLQGDIS